MQILKRRSDTIYLTEMGAFIARRITMLTAFALLGLLPLASRWLVTRFFQE